MSETQLSQPKRKKRIRVAREPPFPVPIASVTKEPPVKNRWFYYTGEFCGNHVFVKHSGDIHYLYKMGFFGKGTLSRSCPEHSQRCQSVAIPDDMGDIVHLRVQNRRTFVRRTNWKKLLENKISESGEMKEVWTSSEDEGEQGEVIDNTDSEMAAPGNLHIDAPALSPEILESETSQNNGREEKNITETVSSWDDVEGDVDFWGSETVDTEAKQKDNVEASWGEGEGDFWGVEDKCETVDVQEKISDDKCETVDVQEKISDDKPELRNCLNTVQYGSVHSDVSKLESDLQKSTSTKTSVKLELNNEKKGITGHDDQCHDQEQSSCQPAVKCDIQSTENCSSETKLKYGEVQSREEEKVITDERKQSLRIKSEQEVMNSGESGVLGAQEMTGIDQVCDPLCEQEDPRGDIFVIEDLDIDIASKKKKPKLKWKAVVKNDPYIVLENLRLSLEESFFLAYGLGCLAVTGKDKKPMNLCEMWRQFSAVQKSFVPNYIVYHYFRAKGWVPKSGLKFGVDFILYKEGPPFYHGSYSVVVKVVDEETLDEDLTWTHRHLSWRALAGLNRITGQVSKELMFCYVIRPQTITAEDLLSPGCIPTFRVQEITLSRWVSNQEREKKAEEEIL